VDDVVGRKGAAFAAFAVFEPLLADLVAADVKFPHRIRHTLESLAGVDPHRVVFVRGKLSQNVLAQLKFKN